MASAPWLPLVGDTPAQAPLCWPEGKPVLIPGVLGCAPIDGYHKVAYAGANISRLAWLPNILYASTATKNGTDPEVASGGKLGYPRRVASSQTTSCSLQELWAIRHREYIAGTLVPLYSHRTSSHQYLHSCVTEFPLGSDGLLPSCYGSGFHWPRIGHPFRCQSNARCFRWTSRIIELERGDYTLLLKPSPPRLVRALASELRSLIMRAMSRRLPSHTSDGLMQSENS